MMDIVKIKADVYQLEQQGKRLPVFQYLKDEWGKEAPSEALTVMTMQQMVNYMDYLQSSSVTSVPREAGNEYDLYHDFLLDAISWGLKEHRSGKMFLWQMCFYVDAWITYDFILGRDITECNAEQWKRTLFEEAKRIYPNSLIFDFIPHVQQGDYPWLHNLPESARKQIRAEIAEWNLQKNSADQALQWKIDSKLSM